MNIELKIDIDASVLTIIDLSHSRFIVTFEILCFRFVKKETFPL